MVLLESSLEWSVQKHYSGNTLNVYARDKRPGESPVNNYLWHPVERKRKQTRFLRRR